MTAQEGRPIIFGELLFDRFDNGNAVLGGAPFNVAWHLRGFGLAPLLISRVGDDDSGRQALDEMRAWGMDTAGVQIDAVHPTGTVEVRFRDGQPGYEILPEQAYDYIEIGAAVNVVRDQPRSLLYHGTLAARNPVSRGSLFDLHRDLNLPTFLDINLRAPWWEPALVERAIRAARWVKLNHDEVIEIVPGTAAADVKRSAAKLCAMTKLQLLIMTLGADGACFFCDGATRCEPPCPVDDLVDTVGAGDAFSAVTILGILNGWRGQDILQRALGFSARICTIRGATVADAQLYAREMEQWKQHEPQEW